MFRRFTPAITVVLAVLFDSAILPIFYTGRYAIMLSLIVVMLISIMCGRMRGMLYGMIAGLLLDIPTGTLGMKLFAMIAIGFIIGFLLDNQPVLYGSNITIDHKERMQYLLVRAIWIAILVLIYEIVMFVIQYFSNAVLEWAYIRDIIIRVLATTLFTMALSPLFHRVYVGNGDAERAKGRKTREVKDY